MTAVPVLRVGIDLVRVREIADSVATFGERYLARLYTTAERAYAESDAVRMPERLAARFAAKEATIKALGLVEHEGAWRDLEVARASPKKETSSGLSCASAPTASSRGRPRTNRRGCARPKHIVD